MKIVVLDAGTLGGDLPLERLGSLNCEVEIFSRTAPEQVAGRIEKCDIIILNKVKLGPDNLAGADSLRLICIAATGYDNIDVKYCSRRGISVCNVAGYSTDRCCAGYCCNGAGAGDSHKGSMKA